MQSAQAEPWTLFDNLDTNRCSTKTCNTLNLSRSNHEHQIVFAWTSLALSNQLGQDGCCKFGGFFARERLQGLALPSCSLLGLRRAPGGD